MNVPHNPQQVFIPITREPTRVQAKFGSGELGSFSSGFLVWILLLREVFNHQFCYKQNTQYYLRFKKYSSVSLIGFPRGQEKE